MPKIAVVLALGLVALVGCRAGLAQGPEREDDQALLGPPPPTDFGCERGGRRVVDTDGDKKGDVILHELEGQAICRGEDTDRDGKVDRWSKLEAGRITMQVEDTDRDGTLDTMRKDSDGDGTLDQVTKVPAAAH